MGKFAKIAERQAVRPSAVRPLENPLRPPDITSHLGGEAWSRSVFDDLYLLGAGNFVSERTFHEEVSSRDNRFLTLLQDALASDPAWVARFASHLRKDLNMRSASIVVAASYAAYRVNGERLPNVRGVVRSVLQRPDEPGEFLAYWFANYDRKIPTPVKRGLADAVVRLYNERAALRYDGISNSWRLGDVIELVHAAPKDQAQSDLFRYLLDHRHRRENPRTSELLPLINARRALESIPADERARHYEAGVLQPLFDAGAGSWEYLSGYLPGGMTASAWEAAIPSMGYMALLRNLRNFSAAGISPQARDRVEATLSDPAEVAKSRLFPLRFFAAYKNAPEAWAKSIEAGLAASLSAVPHYPGRTAILCDVSGSMTYSSFSERGTTTPVQNAALFSLAIAHQCDEAFLYAFDSNIYTIADWEDAPVLQAVDIVSRCGGGGTELIQTIAQINYSYHVGQLDRIIVVTDEQGSFASREVRQAVEAIRIPIHTINVAGYSPSTTDGKRPDRFSYGGLSDVFFRLIPLVEESVERGVDLLSCATRETK